MKSTILFLALLISFAADAQSLKDLLYSGKLKSDSGTVVRKTDDLSTKIDTSRKKPVEPPKAVTAIVGTDSSVNEVADHQVAAPNETRDNATIWKEYIDSAITILEDEVMTSNKIKSGTYYVLVVYEIDVDGQISVNNVSITPDNSFLKEQIIRRVTLTAPQMNIELNAYGQPRKAIKRYNFRLTKK